MSPRRRGARRSRCTGCRSEIEWCVVMPSGKKIAIDPVDTPDGNVVWMRESDGHRIRVIDDARFGPTRVVRVLKADELVDTLERRFKTHWATCPHADRFRRSA